MSNGQGDIYVGVTKQGQILRGLIEFNIAQYIPAGSTITGVSLTMADVSGLNGNQTINLHDVAQAWTQGTSNVGGGGGAPSTNNDVTWYYSSYNATTPSASTQWSKPGGSFSSTVSGSATDNAYTAANPPTGQTVTWSSSQMVADVQSWLNNPSTNFGWLLQNNNETKTQTAKEFETTEANDPSIDYLPELQITYDDEGSSVPEPSSALLALTGVAWCAGMRIRRQGKR
jgi:hypothetical protein